MSGLRRFEIEVRALSPLLIGGQSSPSHGGDKASAHDATGRPVIPASALQGALRIELERLLRGRDGEDAVCGANPAPGGESPGECECPVCRLFGAEGYGIGSLRLEDGVLTEASNLQAVLRPQVAVGRRTGSAVAQHLVFLEPMASAGDEPPVFVARGHLALRTASETAEDLEQDLRHLEAACAALTGLGGGKARGLGWVECTLRKVDRPAERSLSVKPVALPRKAPYDLRLRFEAQAALHFGDGRPLGGFLPTRSSAPGSTVRGAIAFALLEQGLATPEDARFQELVAGGAITFGSARASGDRPSQTRRRCRPNEHVFDDLVGEVLRREAAKAGVALAPRTGGACPEPGCPATKAQPSRWRRGYEEPWRRVRTHTAINRRTGTAMDQKLFSVEVLEPVYAGRDNEPLELTAEVRGLNPGTGGLLAALHGREIWLGGRRSRGMGRCTLRVEEASTAGVAGARRAIDDLTRELLDGWQRLREATSKELPVWLTADELLLAIVLEEPWAGDGSTEVLEQGPLGLDAGEVAGRLVPEHGFVAVVEEGRFGAVEASRFGAAKNVARGEVAPEVAAGPGSVYVYRVARGAVESSLAEWVAAGRAGSGVNKEIGWGRFSVRGPHLDD